MNASNSENNQGGRLFRYAAIATIVGPVVGAAIALFIWFYPRSPNSPSLNTEMQSTGLEFRSEIEQADPPAGDDLPVPLVEPPPIAEKPAPTVHPEPILFSLRNGEQKVFSHGDLSVSGDFNQIGDTVVPTLHLQARGQEPEDHALLSAGGRFKVAIGSKTFVVSVLGTDESAQTFKLQVDLRE